MSPCVCNASQHSVYPSRLKRTAMNAELTPVHRLWRLSAPHPHRQTPLLQTLQLSTL